MKHREKKQRGWRRKQWNAQWKQWRVENRHRAVVSVSQVTVEGFWLHTFRGDFYVSREKFHWFKNATDKEIRDVSVILCTYDANDDGLEWSTLDLHFRIADFDPAVSTIRTVGETNRNI